MQHRLKQFLSKSFLMMMTLCLLVLAGCASDSSSTSGSSSTAPVQKDEVKVVTVEFLYLEHPPVKPVIEQVNKTFDKYKDKIKVVAHSFDSKEGQALAEEHKLTGHTPAAIFIDGSMTVKLGDREVKFFSFPKGAGTLKMADGGWTYEDLDAALAQVTGTKS